MSQDRSALVKVGQPSDCLHHTAHSHYLKRMIISHEQNRQLRIIKQLSYVIYSTHLILGVPNKGISWKFLGVLFALNDDIDILVRSLVLLLTTGMTEEDQGPDGTDAG